jgi:hypothetical protein
MASLIFLCYLVLRTSITLLVVSATLGATAINHVPSISRDHELIQALGCNIHYCGAPELMATLVDL